jgi:hypothetical protein
MENGFLSARAAQNEFLPVDSVTKSLFISITSADLSEQLAGA